MISLTEGLYECLLILQLEWLGQILHLQPCILVTIVLFEVIQKHEISSIRAVFLCSIQRCSWCRRDQTERPPTLHWPVIPEDWVQFRQQVCAARFTSLIGKIVFDYNFHTSLVCAFSRSQQIVSRDFLKLRDPSSLGSRYKSPHLIKQVKWVLFFGQFCSDRVDSVSISANGEVLVCLSVIVKTVRLGPVSSHAGRTWVSAFRASKPPFQGPWTDGGREGGTPETRLFETVLSLKLSLSRSSELRRQKPTHWL
jgi:hypothetical protein